LEITPRHLSHYACRDSINNNAILNIRDNRGPDTNYRLTSDADFVPNGGTEPDPCSMSDFDRTAECDSRTDVDTIFDAALVTNARSGVDDDVFADPAAWIDDRARCDKRSATDLHTPGHDGCWMNHRRELKALPPGTFGALDAGHIVADCDDQTGHAGSQRGPQGFCAGNPNPAQHLTHPIGIDIVHQTVDLPQTGQSYGVQHHESVAPGTPDDDTAW
jgi:hypothetical protein